MSAQSAERLERYRASLEDYLALPEGTRAEYVDGEVLVTPPAAVPHNRIGVRLIRLFEDALSGIWVTYEPGFRTTESRFRVPDLAVVADSVTGDDVWLTQAPVVVVEILSGGTRAEDTYRKAPEYLAAGVEQYWLVDRDARTITVLRAATVNGAQEWEVVLNLDAEVTTGEVQVGDHGTVPLDLGAIMPE